ncbi:MAG: hypothetical protein COW54_08635 [Rhodobacteraceae bacterium CG17_big_fil_post_rev_8_21_14_2_50_63_15]|nr:MAG: hypothetical protein COW54_08635 [Rhodobacteraceae bacterium CG17_big_fil_post_rev_8_21_14_2_50_63_15]
MTDLNALTKSAINALLATPLTASQLKKKSHADLVAMFDAMSATDALDADLRDARTNDPTPPMPKAPNVVAMPKKGRNLEDRVLVEPTSDLSNVRPIREGTKRHAMVQALLSGCTLDELATATGWKRDVASAAIYTDLRAAGLGVRRENGVLHLMLPKGSNVVPLRKPAAPAQKAANK